MSSVQHIIEQILGSQRLRESTLFANRSFADEPIIQRGSQMTAYLPQRCREMRALASLPELRRTPEAQLFVRQARLMCDYEDDVSLRGSFRHYFPTYQSMNDHQLRAYFSWRAHVRAGDVQPTSTSFAYVYVYELLCGVGVVPGLEGLRAIEAFWQSYREFEPGLDRHLKPWLRDYCVWHSLPLACVEPYVDLSLDHAVIAVRDGIAAWGPDDPGATRPGEEALLSELAALSTYHLRESRLFRARPETLGHVCCAVIVGLAGHYARRRKRGLIESLFGPPVALPHAMFANAVFWSDLPHADTTYELSGINRFVCQSGQWYWERSQHVQRSKELGSVLGACDQRLRAAIGYEHPLVEKDVPKYLAKIIDREVAARLAWEREREARTVRVDLSALAGIRKAAASTREALLVDEEREEDGLEAVAVAPLVDMGPCMAGFPVAVNPVPKAPALTGASAPKALALVGADSSSPLTSMELLAGAQAKLVWLAADAKPVAAAATPKPAAASGSAAAPGPPAPGPATAPEPPAPAPPAKTTALPYGLTAEELGFIGSLLGDPAPATVPSTSLDMLADSINEKLFDLLGDTAIELDAMSGTAAIIEDYREDLREALCLDQH